MPPATIDSFSSRDTAQLSLEEPEVEPDIDIVGQNATADGSLCILCRPLDFEYIGYHDSVDYLSNNYFVQRDFVSVSTNQATCALCRRIVRLIDDWVSRAPLEQAQHLNVARSRVEIRLDTDWHVVSDELSGVERKTHSDRLRVNFLIPKSNCPGGPVQDHSLIFYFQRYADGAWRPAFDAGLAGAGTHISSLASATPYSGRRRSLTVDFALLRSWKSMCQAFHGTKCSNIFKSTPGSPPRVIDVQQRCLVQTTKTDNWVCLSYVWGTTKTTTLSKNNIRLYQTPGALDRSVLPNIVEDAIQVTIGLQERFLWVDSLCIVQDDPGDKEKFISDMDSIYASAVVVIIAATCIDANSSLPGVRSSSRSRGPDEFSVRNVPLIQSLDPVTGVRVDLRTGRAGAYLGTTIWDTRAWTLQERFLASRSLVFTAEQIFWECEEAFWCEDSCREIVQVGPDPHRTSLCGGELNLSWNSDYITFDHYYRVLLGEYSTRKLKYESDGLNAFSGVIRAFERSMGVKFFWGMPCAFLESALAWGNRNTGLKRRSGGHAASGTGFPSWSWVGWSSEGLARMDNQNLTMEALGLQFYRMSEDGKCLELLKQNGRVNEQLDLLAEGSTIEARSTRPQTGRLDDVPRTTSVSPALLLCFWTASAHVEIFHQNSGSNLSRENQSDTQWGISLCHRTHNIQVSWFHLPPLAATERKQVEIIAVAQNRGNWDGGHKANGAIGVMVINWKEGIAFREGLAWIAIRDWISLDDRSWKWIVLA